MRARRFLSASFSLLLALAPALANSAAPRSPIAPGDNQKPYLVSADELQFDQDLGLIVAKGHVELSQGDQVMLADIVTYNQRTDTATASGHVTLVQPGGDIAFADFAELQDNFKNGFVRNIRLLLSDRSRLAGNTARRIQGNRTEIRRGVYSPCDLCKDDPTRAPVWQIRAEQVVHDKDLQIVEYRDAVMEIDGVPVFYAPYFWHPDPSVKRATGFLPPSVGYTSSLGTHMEIPYYWALAPDRDFTFTPMFTTQAGTVLDNHYRQRFGFGEIDVEGSIAIDPPQQSTDSAGNPVSTNGLRGHIFASGEFDLDNNWRDTFNIQRSSDITYLLLYRYQTPPDFLTSYNALENFQPNSYGNISAWGFQSLWPGVSDKTEPFALPIVDYMWVGSPGNFGGQLTVAANALNLVRISGFDERRLSTGASWQRPFDGLIGDRFNLSVSARGDGYYDGSVPNPASLTGATQTVTAGRFFPQAALTWRYPWVRRANGYSELIEPVVMGVAAPNTGNFGRIPNEDSQAFQFDDSDLFVANRFPGFDLVDTGQRVDYGLRGGIYADHGGSVRFLVGQSYAFQHNNEFLPGSGLSTQLSDLVGRVTLTPFDELNLTYRFRLAHDNLAMRAQEVATQFGPQSFNVSVSYAQLAAVTTFPQLVKREELGATLSVELTRHWSADFQELHDFNNSGVNINASLGLTYRDECFAVTGAIAQSGIQIGDVKPGVSVLFTFVFKNLGEFGVHATSFQY